MNFALAKPTATIDKYRTLYLNLFHCYVKTQYIFEVVFNSWKAKGSIGCKRKQMMFLAQTIYELFRQHVNWSEGF